MKTNRASLLIGLLAGFATALLALSAGAPSSMSFFLLSAATLPVLIATLGWSDVAGVTAVVVASVLIGVALSPLVAFMFLATSLGPAAWIGHLANLARPAEEIGGPAGSLAWYPLSRIMLHLCALVTIGLIVLGFVVGYGRALVGEVVDAFIAVMKQQSPSYDPSADTVAAMKDFFAHALPAVQGALWVVILFASLYIAGFLVRASGRSRRPKDDVPAALRMPRAALGAFLLGVVLTFFGGAATLIGSAVCGAFGAGFVLAGFAILHDRTRGRTWRFAALWLGYISVLLFTVPLVLFFFAGLVDSTGVMPASRRAGPHDPK
ncbi:MAG: DUF2232 domain-containing protein [Pararhizobium sp.]